MNTKVYRTMYISTVLFALALIIAMSAVTRKNTSMIHAYCVDKPHGSQLWAEVYCP